MSDTRTTITSLPAATAGAHDSLTDFEALRQAHEAVMADLDANRDAYDAHVERACQEAAGRGVPEPEVANVRRLWGRGLLALTDVDDLLAELVAEQADVATGNANCR